jgi:hypothetical protein
MSKRTRDLAEVAAAALSSVAARAPGVARKAAEVGPKVAKQVADRAPEVARRAAAATPPFARLPRRWRREPRAWPERSPRRLRAMR